MTDPIRVETEGHHILITPKSKPEPERKGNPFLALFAGFLLLAIAVNLWGASSHSPTVHVTRPAVQGSSE